MGGVTAAQKENSMKYLSTEFAIPPNKLEAQCRIVLNDIKVYLKGTYSVDQEEWILWDAQVNRIIVRGDTAQRVCWLPRES